MRTTKAKQLPFEPEPWLILRNRLSFVWDYPFDLEQMARDKYYGNDFAQPSEDRCFTFDCSSGVRLIICAEYLCGTKNLHVSAVAHNGLAKKLLRMPAHLVPSELVEQAQAASFFVGISLPDVPDVWTAPGIPHWFLFFKG